MKRLDAALNSLMGIWVGDAFGGHFEFESVDWHRPQRAFQKRDLPSAIWRYTDDTQMALSVYDMLRQHGEIIPNKLAKSFSQHFDISRGYGVGAEQLLTDIRAGGDWSKLASGMFDGTGSFGNGAAMRVAPVGAYFADDLKKVVENAEKSAIVTHTHPDGIAGAIAVALATACQFTKNTDTQSYWEIIIEYTPSGNLVDKLQEAAKLDKATPTQQAAKILGSGWGVSAVDTVPFALWCANTHFDDFEEALWQAISVGGDTDTIGAIVGGIVAAHRGKACISEQWRNRCEPMPAWIELI